MRFIKDLLFSEENLIKRARDFSETYSAGYSVTDISTPNFSETYEFSASSATDICKSSQYKFFINVSEEYKNYCGQDKYFRYGRTDNFYLNVIIKTNNASIIYAQVSEIFDVFDYEESTYSVNVTSWDGPEGWGRTERKYANTHEYVKKFTSIKDACNWCIEVNMATKAIACVAYLLGKENEMLSSAEMDKSIADRKQREKEVKIKELQRFQELQRQKHRQEVENEKIKKEKQRKAEQQRKEYEKKFKIGNIKIFYSAKLFGFIDMNGKDVFFHFSDVVNENDPQKVLKNTEVKFIPVDTKKGLKATNVKILYTLNG